MVGRGGGFRPEHVRVSKRKVKEVRTGVRKECKNGGEMGFQGTISSNIGLFCTAKN